MLNLQEIDDTIEELENGPTTFDTCIKLSALYNIKEHLQDATMKLENDVEKELSDILPHYRKYVEVKRAFQHSEADKAAVLALMQSVCAEIKEFLMVLYSSTDTAEERDFLRLIIEETRSKMV